jgi:hypothetical protein
MLVGRSPPESWLSRLLNCSLARTRCTGFASDIANAIVLNLNGEADHPADGFYAARRKKLRVLSPCSRTR